MQKPFKISGHILKVCKLNPKKEIIKSENQWNWKQTIERINKAKVGSLKSLIKLINASQDLTREKL